MRYDGVWLLWKQIGVRAWMEKVSNAGYARYIGHGVLLLANSLNVLIPLAMGWFLGKPLGKRMVS